MQNTGLRPARGHALISLILLLSWLATAAAPVFSSSSPAVERALTSAVRIGIELTFKDGRSRNVFGSGWTRSCDPTSLGKFDVVVATAGHVVDIAELETEFAQGGASLVRVVVAYRDGRAFAASRESLSLDRTQDYGEVRFLADRACQTLPVGVADSVALNDPLTTVASPSGLRFGVFTGHLVMRAPLPIRNCPESAWMTSIHIGPGASGAPVFDQQGNVVATVIALVTFPWGDAPSIVVPIPPTLKKGGL